MKNVIVCEKCGTENPVYRLTCKECNSFLRDRVNNIDFWKTFWKIFDSPNKAFLTIIYAKAKNMVTPLLILAGIKASLVSLQIKTMFTHANFNIDWLSFILIGTLLSVLLITGFSYLVTIVNKSFGLQTRFKDNLAIYTYAFIPLIITLFLLLPVEFALFGEYWYLANPLSTEINSTAAHILLFIEVVMLLWSFILLITANYVQTKNTVYSFTVSFVLSIIVFGAPAVIF